MQTKTRPILIALVAVVWLALAVWCWIKPADASSLSERRQLAQMPALRTDTLLSGSFMSGFESYTQDQFPLRDGFRTLKAVFSLYGLGQLDNNGIYVSDGYAARLLWPLAPDQITSACEKLTNLYETYFAGTDARVFFAVIPDKSYYLADQAGRLTLDFDALSELVQAGTPWAEHLDLTGTLSLDSYYRTDTHWRQEALGETAGVIAAALGIPLEETVQTVTVTEPFYGVYYGQSALPLAPDTLHYLTSDTLSACTVYNYETGETGGIYDLDGLHGADPYDVFLSGAEALLRIDNPSQNNGKTLVVFRDSFGSSLIPLLVSGYEPVYAVDPRYIVPDLIGQLVEFPDDADVLSLYSTLLLNESGALR